MKRTDMLIAMAVVAATLWLLTTGCEPTPSTTVSAQSPTTRQTGFVTTEQAPTTSNTTAISEAEAISIAKEYIDQVDRANTTTVPPGASTTDGWVPVEVEVTSAVLGKPTSLYGPSGFDGPVWTIKMTTSKTTFTVVVVIDAMTGNVVGGTIW
jgi:hypothetical protein